MSNYTYFLNDPELKKRHELVIPTEEMYRFIPPENEIIVIDPSNADNNIRFIFNGLPKTDLEKTRLIEFQNYENEHGKINYPPTWLESDTMRYLQASEYNLKVSYNKIKEQAALINAKPKSINDRIIKLLNSGYIYMYGRDHHFRPILVLELVKVADLVEKEGYTLEEINMSLDYLLDYIIKYIFIPGQIENWVLITDFKDIGLSKMGKGKDIIGALNKYRGRVFRNFMINIGGFISMAVKGIISLFGKASSKKVKILDENELYKMNELIRPDNIQQKYGGTAPNVVYGGNNLFPPVVPSQKYLLDNDTSYIISPEAYKEMCINSNPYKPFVICPYYENLWKQEQNNNNNVNNNAGVQKNIQKQNIMQNQIKQMDMQNNRDRRSSLQYNAYNNRNGKQQNIRMQQMQQQKRVLDNRNYIMSFLSEFKELENLDNNINLNYSIPRKIDYNEINCFFRNISNIPYYSIH